MCRICNEGYYIDNIGKCHLTVIKENKLILKIILIFLWILLFVAIGVGVIFLYRRFFK